MTALAAPLAETAEIAPGLMVLEHLSRNEVMDVYDVWDERRYCRCVVKALRPDCERSPRDRRRLRREGELLARFTHPHIVRAYETIVAPRLMVVLEALPGETLSHLLDRRSRRAAIVELAILGLQVGSATRYLHAEGWLHLDLKPSNVIIDGGIAKLLDLSLARPPGPNAAGIGTRPYLSPEQARGGELTAAADVWGLGSLLWEAACGDPPFADDADDEDGGRAAHPQLHTRAPSVRGRRRMPSALGELIDACLEPDPADRPPIDAVLAGLERFA
jgi:eukaryotic-like serine/threonine-protein kinase